MSIEKMISSSRYPDSLKCKLTQSSVALFKFSRFLSDKIRALRTSPACEDSKARTSTEINFYKGFSIIFLTKN